MHSPCNAVRQYDSLKKTTIKLSTKWLLRKLYLTKKSNPKSSENGKSYWEKNPKAAFSFSRAMKGSTNTHRWNEKQLTDDGRTRAQAGPRGRWSTPVQPLKAEHIVEAQRSLGHLCTLLERRTSAPSLSVSLSSTSRRPKVGKIVERNSGRPSQREGLVPSLTNRSQWVVAFNCSNSKAHIQEFYYLRSRCFAPTATQMPRFKSQLSLYTQNHKIKY